MLSLYSCTCTVSCEGTYFSVCTLQQHTAVNRPYLSFKFLHLWIPCVLVHACLAYCGLNIVL